MRSKQIHKPVIFEMRVYYIHNNNNASLYMAVARRTTRYNPITSSRGPILM